VQRHMLQKICRLCELNPAIKHSHTIPAFIYRAIKKSSPTGYLRLDKSPNMRLQDGDKAQLLCADCEQLFGKHEKKFNDYIFNDFLNFNLTNFTYGNWLHYFITSVTWRILIMDIASEGIPEKVLSELKIAENMMRKYLLGDQDLSKLINNHSYFFINNAEPNDYTMAAAILMIRRGTSGYTLWKHERFISIIVNLTGILCVTHIHLEQKDIWNNTQVYPINGKFEFPQNVDSWIYEDFLRRSIECYRRGADLTEKQIAIIKNSVRVNA
jgi:hypothetical protein